MLRLAGRPPLPIPAAGLEVDLPMDAVAVLQGRRGVTETLWRQRIGVEAPGAVALGLRVLDAGVR